MLPRIRYSPPLSEMIVYMSHGGFGEQFTKMILEYADEGLQLFIVPGEYTHLQVKDADRLELIGIIGDDIFEDMILDEIEIEPANNKMIDYLLEYLLENRYYVRILA